MSCVWCFKRNSVCFIFSCILPSVVKWIEPSQDKVQWHALMVGMNSREFCPKYYMLLQWNSSLWRCDCWVSQWFFFGCILMNWEDIHEGTSACTYGVRYPWPAWKYFPSICMERLEKYMKQFGVAGWDVYQVISEYHCVQFFVSPSTILPLTFNHVCGWSEMYHFESGPSP